MSRKLERLEELFPSKYEKFKEKCPNWFEEFTTEEITSDSVNDLIYSCHFLDGEIEYQTFSHAYVIVRYNLNDKQLYTIDLIDGSNNFLGKIKKYPAGTDVLYWENPIKLFIQLYSRSYCPIKNYILDGSLEYQSDFKLYFDHIENMLGEGQKRLNEISEMN